MLRLTRNALKAMKPKAAANHMRQDKIDLSNLSAQQFDEIKKVIANVDSRKSSASNEAVDESTPRLRCYVPFQHWHDGKSPRSKVKDSNIQFEQVGFPNYPGDPLPFMMVNVNESELNKRRMMKHMYKQETMFQFAPFRRTLYNVGRCSQEILPKALVESAMAEFVSVSKGNAKRIYANTGATEGMNKNLWSSYKQTNPRFTARFDQCMVTGRYQGLIPRYRLHRMFFRKYADANQISGLRTALYGPKPNFCQNTNLKHWNKDLNQKFDDRVEYS